MVGFRTGGPDVSSYQSDVHWEEVSKHHRFAICKATEGLTYVDPKFSTNWQGIRDVGMIRGAYHFARPQPGHSGRAEALHFLSIVNRLGGFRRGDLRPVLDIEWSSGLPGVALQVWVSEFVHTIGSAVGQMPIIYTGSWWRDHRLTHHYGCPLWLAAYVRVPAFYVPRPWRRWSLWQYKDNAHVSGVRGPCDFSRVRSGRTLRRLRLR